MQVWRQHRRNHRCRAGRLIIGVLALVLLFGCGGTSSTPGSTPTPSPVGTLAPTPTPVPTHGITPTPQPTTSPCDTPPRVQPVSSAEIDSGNAGRPRIALTFDAGGPSDPTSRILDILAKYQVRVTFFVTGDWANQNPDLVRRIHGDGHEIGNHTMHHPDLKTLPNEQVCNELNQAEQVISTLTGVTTRPYYRPPYGSRDGRVRGLAAHLGYRTVYWTVDTLDWQTTATPDSITKIVMDHLSNGVIILMHAGSQVESQTLDGLMTKIEQAGYQIVSLTAVLQ
jgi:peptidoglycan/xylan/chitin deacetylase (PgdA/CDA1 family)